MWKQRLFTLNKLGTENLHAVLHALVKPDCLTALARHAFHEQITTWRTCRLTACTEEGLPMVLRCVGLKTNMS